MKKALLLLLMVSTTVLATPQFDESPEKPFSTASNKYKTVTLTWLTSKNPQATCNAEAKKRGYNNFGFSVMGCAFWDANQCTIVTKESPNMHTLGHEVRHCFQGDWHSNNGQ